MLPRYTNPPERFLSTPSARRATNLIALPPLSKPISIHALREEGDLFPSSLIFAIFSISIHALREEGDPGRSKRERRRWQFLSTPSARRATPFPTPLCVWSADFYPRPPRGGRPPRPTKLWRL